MSDFTQLALIGPTASGKSALALKVAEKINAFILSLDSLSIYKEIDIVSAKPSKEERALITHFGIDHLSPDEPFDVTLFMRLYQDVAKRCRQEGKNLVIVGGTSFYLKALMEGISQRPALTEAQKEKISLQMRKVQETYTILHSLDALYMQRIMPQDTYRIQKALEIYLATGEKPSDYFAAHPPSPLIVDPLPIYEIVWEREELRARIRQRTEQMLQEGLIDEIIMLERNYTRAPNCMKAIGIKETLMYLDGLYGKKMLIEKIAINTGRLAKRQVTFNSSQFENVTKDTLEGLEKRLLRGL